MELFLPSIFILLLGGAVVFFFLPRFGPLTLAALSLILLAIGVYHHATMFGTEYRLSTWQYGLIGYAPYVLVGGLLLVILFYLLSLLPAVGGKAENAAAAAAANQPIEVSLPAAETAPNILTRAVNNGIRNVANVAGVKLNKGNNTFQLPLPNLGVGTPAANRGNRGLNFPPSQV